MIGDQLQQAESQLIERIQEAKRNRKAILGFEPRFPESKSDVLTTALYRRSGMLRFDVSEVFKSKDTDSRLG